uniref:Protein LET-805 n=1 Tax=Anisakis pegreffii TaxID=303229 RepID=A0A3G6JF52_9BILA|nr:protein LET-805 [Anisakis pegreffii]
MDDDYGARDDRFHEGYVKGLRDAGMTGMTTSMHNLAQRGQGGGSYSAGYMQGFRDGNSGVFGDRISTNLLRRLEDQYPNQEEFRTGYIEGFKEGTGSRTTEHRTFEETRRLQESLTKLTEILSDKSKGAGDEIHTTKIYHVYNQQPEGIGVSYSSAASAKQLEQELEELTSSSRRSTLRRHYTPGDYLKYGSDLEGYGSLRGNRRSLSASALARDGGAAGVNQMGAAGASQMSEMRSQASQMHDTGQSSQIRDMNQLSEMHELSRMGGIGGVTSQLSGQTSQMRDAGQSSQMRDMSEMHELSQLSSVGGGTSHQMREMTTTQMGGAAMGPSSHNWPDDLINIVNEPMGQTMDRMKKYSTSMSHVDRDGGDEGGIKESVEERYQRSYKEEYSTGGH